MPAPHTFTAKGSAQLETATVKLGSASGQFTEATSDWIVSTADSDWNFGSGDFTIEGFFYANSYSGFDIVCGIGRDSNHRGFLFGFESANHYPSFWWSSTLTTWDINNTTFTSSSPSTGAWHHFAIVRSGNTVHCYIDGTEQGTGQSVAGFATLANDGSSDLTFGAAENDDGTAGSFFNGFLDECRVSNTARYTANFTAPSAEFTNDANTKVLLHMNGANGSTTFTDSATGATTSVFRSRMMRGIGS